MVDAVDGFLLGKRYVRTDRDPEWCRSAKLISDGRSRSSCGTTITRGIDEGLDNALIVPGEVMDSTGELVRRARLCGLLGVCCREAA
jgi:hypothetical protein